MIPCAEIVSRASIINTWKILGDYQVFVENTRESPLTLGSVADSSSAILPTGRVSFHPLDDTGHRWGINLSAACSSQRESARGDAVVF